MNQSIKTIKASLLSIMQTMNNTPNLYCNNPRKDFTRKRKLEFKESLRILLSIGGKSLNSELMNYFSYDVHAATTSAFIQQRQKILPDAFEYLFHTFTMKKIKFKEFLGHRLLAVDGTDINIPHNKKDLDTYFVNTPGTKGYNQIHANCLFDISTNIYVDALIQKGRNTNENKALLEMVDRSPIKDKVILIADRGYENYNVIEHISRKGWRYLIRIKDITSNGIASSLSLPTTDVFDIDYVLNITRRQTKDIKLNKDKYKFLASHQQFDARVGHNPAFTGLQPSVSPSSYLFFLKIHSIFVIEIKKCTSHSLS